MILGSMLKDILEAEKRAKEYTEEAEKYKAETMADIEEQKKKIINDKLEEAELEVQKMRSGHEKSIKNSLKSVENATEASIKKLASLEKEHFSDWTKEIYDRVISDS